MGSEDSSQTSVAGFHPSGRGFGFDVAPSSAEKGAPATFNTLRQRLVAVACWRMNKSLFDFDSSFIKPEISEDLRRLRGLIQGAPGTLAAVFGHADPTGNDDYNKELAGRRARALFALLIRDAAAWEKLFSSPTGGDSWGLRSTQRILQTLRRPEGSDAPGTPYYSGGVDGAFGPQTDAAVRAFQKDNGLGVDGIAGPKTRGALYPLYMDAVCISPDDRFAMDPKDFVGEGADAEGKGAMQGCGEFNPIRVLSKADQNKDQRSRDAKNAPNRRVLVFLFEKELLPPFATWPCPRATEGSAGCKAQFFPDGNERRAVAAEEKTYRKERNTMACAFYDRLARASPCEGGVRFQVLEGRILLARGGPAANMPFVVRVGGQVVDGGFTDEQGRYRVEGVAGSTEVALVDRLQMAATSEEPGREIVAVRTRPLRDDEDPTAGDSGDTAVA